jgi:hypothetical protein
MRWKNIKKGYKISGVVILGLIVGLLVFQQFLRFYVPKIIRSQINRMVVDGSDSLYLCSIGKISVNLFTGSVKITDLNITIDSTRFEQRKMQHKLPGLVFKMELKSGTIHGLKLYPLVFANKTIVRSIMADGANLSFSRTKQVRPNAKKNIPSELELWNVIKPHIRGIYIERILLSNIRLGYKSLVEDKYVDFSYQSCSASFKDIRIDSLGAVNPSRILFTKQLTFQITGVRYLTPDSIYLLNLDTFTYSSFFRKLRVQGLSLHPTISPQLITRKHGMQIDVVDVDLPELRVNDFHVEKVFTNNEIQMDTIIVQEPIVNIHRDRTAHFDTTSQLGKFPNELLANAPMNIRVQKIIIDDAEVHYLETQKLSHLIGDAGFYHVSGTVSNITNQLSDSKRDQFCTISLKGIFMEDADLEVEVIFDLRSPNGEYKVDITMGHIHLSALNKLVIPFANVRMKTLELQESKFHIAGNAQSTVGYAYLKYRDLNMEVLKVNPATLEVKSDAFTSFMANLIAVRSDNPGRHKNIVGEARVTRKRRQPFSHIIYETCVESAKKVMIKVPADNIKVDM